MLLLYIYMTDSKRNLESCWAFALLSEYDRIRQQIAMTAPDAPFIIGFSIMLCQKPPIVAIGHSFADFSSEELPSRSIHNW